MSRSARETTATLALLSRVEERATGKLAVGSGDLQIAVHFLNGDLIAATAADDSHQLVRILSLRGVLTSEQADQLEERLEQGESVFGDLLEIAGGPVLDGILRDRFHQTLCEFVASTQEPVFYAQKGVFVENIQLGHDTRELVASMCDNYDAAMKIDPDLQLVRGIGEPGRDAARAMIVAQLGDTPRTVRSVIQGVPLEPIRAKLLVADLLEAGIADLPLEDQDTMSGDEAPLPELSRPLPPTPVFAVGQSTIAPLDAPPLPLHAHTHLELAEDDEPEEDPEDITDEPTQQGGLAHWLDSAHVDDEELDFFGDYDSHRGVGGDGAFSTKDHHRDRVDLDLSDPAGGPNGSAEHTISLEPNTLEPNGAGTLDDPLEALEAEPAAPAIRYGGPMLSEDEAMSKLEVANEVLGKVVRAFDRANGAGRGRAVVQLLVDGGPSRYATLMHDLTVTERGGLPGPLLLRNLFSRPPTEHRQLLHNSLVDIIERALSFAADELPEEHFDRVLETVAGYRHRLRG